jgi:PIN domain nuclease of toxin-antitoxin system
VIVVDTHVLLWLSFAPEKISKKATEAIKRARENAEGVAISSITLFEVAMAVSKGPIQLDASLDSFLQEVESTFVVLPIDSRVCVKAMALPASYPKDPADRIIGATALAEGLSLLTADRAIRNSHVVETIW